MADMEWMERRYAASPAARRPHGFANKALVKVITLALQGVGAAAILCLAVVQASGIGFLITMTAKMLDRISWHGPVKSIHKLNQAIQTKIDQGLGHVLKKLWARLWVGCFKATRIPWLVRSYYRWQGYKLLPVATSRIGHAAAELDAFVKESILTKRSMGKALLLAPRHRHGVNSDLIRMFAKHVHIIEQPLLCDMLSNWKTPMEIRFSGLPSIGGFEQFDVSKYASPTESATYPAILEQYGDRPPVIAFAPREREKGIHFLRMLGVPANAWHVCVHCREPGFHGYEGDESNVRDSNIANYQLAMSRIVERGGWCIRMGDSSMKRLPAMPGVIDYAHHALRSAGWMFS